MKMKFLILLWKGNDSLSKLTKQLICQENALKSRESAEKKNSGFLVPIYSVFVR